MHDFRFRKTVMRNDYTKIFSTPGRRRSAPWRKVLASKVKHFRSASIRRANTGWKNKMFNRLAKFKFFIRFGLKKRSPISRFRR
jgi:hypothetical protein